MEAWYFLKSEAKKRLNDVLELPAIGIEQDWEVELADKRRWKEFLQLLVSSRFPANSEEEIALAALLIGSIDDAISDEEFTESDAASVAEYFNSKPELRAKVFSVWCTQRKPFNSEIITLWLLPHPPPPQ